MSRRVDLPASGRIAKILVIKWSAMGDVVIATAAMEDLVRAFPDATFHLNTTRPWDRLFEADPRFEQVFCMDLRGSERGLAGMWRWVQRVRRERYDLIVDLQSSDHTWALVAMLQLTVPRIPYRMGHRRGFPYNIVPDWQDPHAPAFENARRTLAAGGVVSQCERPALYPPPRTTERVSRLLHAHGLVPDRFAIFLPGSQASGRLKRWGASRYAELARALVPAEVDKVALLGGPDESDECERIATQAEDAVVNLCGETELFDIVGICRAARFVIGNDTGTAHVASASERPMLVICGPTDPRRVRPMGANVRTVQTSGLDCINCYFKAPCEHHSCMARLTPNEILAQARAHMG